MNKIFYALSFVLGGVVGSLVTLKYAEKKYRKIADEEVESVKAEFSKNKKIFMDEVKTEVLANVAKEKPDILNYSSILNKEGYADKKESTAAKDKDTEPYQIHEARFGEFEDYSLETLKYYSSNDIFTDDLDETLEDLSVIPADDIREYFKEHKGTDCVYIRNEKLKTDYEVLLVLISYDEVLAENPYLNSARLTDE